MLGFRFGRGLGENQAIANQLAANRRKREEEARKQREEAARERELARFNRARPTPPPAPKPAPRRRTRPALKVTLKKPPAPKPAPPKPVTIRASQLNIPKPAQTELRRTTRTRPPAPIRRQIAKTIVPPANTRSLPKGVDRTTFKQVEREVRNLEAVPVKVEGQSYIALADKKKLAPYTGPARDESESAASARETTKRDTANRNKAIAGAVVDTAQYFIPVYGTIKETTELVENWNNLDTGQKALGVTSAVVSGVTDVLLVVPGVGLLAKAGSTALKTGRLASKTAKVATKVSKVGKVEKIATPKYTKALKAKELAKIEKYKNTPLDPRFQRALANAAKTTGKTTSKGTSKVVKGAAALERTKAYKYANRGQLGAVGSLVAANVLSQPKGTSKDATTATIAGGLLLGGLSRGRGIGKGIGKGANKFAGKSTRARGATSTPKTRTRSDINTKRFNRDIRNNKLTFKVEGPPKLSPSGKKLGGKKVKSYTMDYTPPKPGPAKVGIGRDGQNVLVKTETVAKVKLTPNVGKSAKEARRIANRAKAKQAPKTKAQTKAKPEVKPKPTTKPKPIAKAKPAPKAKAKPKTTPKAKPAPKAKAKTQPKLKPIPSPKAKVRPKAQPKLKPIPTPGFQPDPELEPQLEATPTPTPPTPPPPGVIAPAPTPPSAPLPAKTPEPPGTRKPAPATARGSLPSAPKEKARPKAKTKSGRRLFPSLKSAGQLKKDEIPTKVAFRQGVTEISVDLYSTPKQKVRYGADLHKQVPNNPRSNPRETVRIIEKRKISPNENANELTRKFRHGFVEIQASPGKLGYRKVATASAPKPRKTKKAPKYRKRRGISGMTSRLNRLRG